MVEVAVFILVVWICGVDIRSHRIPNELTLVLALTLLFDSVTSEFHGFLISAVACILIAYLGKLGAGDVKLFLVLLATSGQLVLSESYFLGMAVISLIHLAASLSLSYLRGRKRPPTIAFAPSILIPFLPLYLAI